MSTVQKFKVKTRLSTLAVGHGGITANEALKRANVALEAVLPPCVAMIDETLAEMEQRFGAGVPHREREPLSDLYLLSSRIIDVAIALPDSGIDQAANALCELVDLSIAAGRMSWVAVDVHLRALQLLRMHGATLPESRRNAIIGGLRDVVIKRFGPPPL